MTIDELKAENKALQEKFDMAMQALEEVMKPENDCMLRQRDNSYIIREALAKIKEIK